MLWELYNVIPSKQSEGLGFFFECSFSKVVVQTTLCQTLCGNGPKTFKKPKNEPKNCISIIYTNISYTIWMLKKFTRCEK